MILLLTLEEHGINNHGSLWVLHLLGDLWQFATSGLGRPLVDGVHCTSLVPEVDFGMVVVVMLFAVFHKIISKGDGAGTVEAVADLPGSVARLSITHLEKSSIQSCSITNIHLSYV